MNSAGPCIVLWNLEWAPSGSARGIEIKKQLSGHTPDIICLTESHASFLEGGHQIEAQADYGYPAIADRRKVILWSRRPWTQVDYIGDPVMPGGRFVRGQTETSVGPLTVIGICIPWSAAHVSTGRRDAQRWQEHIRYIQGLRSVLATAGSFTIVLGDFNQTVPRSRQPPVVYEALETALGSSFQLATADLRDQFGRAAIDHVAHSHDLEMSVDAIMPARLNEQHLSDHFGIVASLRTSRRLR